MTASAGKMSTEQKKLIKLSEWGMAMRNMGILWRINFVLAAVSLIFLGHRAPAQEDTTESVDQKVSATNAAVALQAHAEQTTAPVFVPTEIQDVGGQWIIPEESEGEMAVRKATPSPPTPQETSQPRAVPAPPEESSSATAPQEAKPEKVSSAAQKPAGEKTLSREKETIEMKQRDEEEGSRLREKAQPSPDENEEQGAEVAPPRPLPIRVVGTVKSVKPVARNELEVTVKTRDRGEVKVLVSPLQVTRVPGTGRRIQARGYIIRQGRSGTTIRAMEVNSADDGVRLPPPTVFPPAPLVVSEWCS